MSIPYPVIRWADPVAMVRAHLAGLLPDARVVVQTDTWLGTTAATSSMQLPLVLVESVPGGGVDETYSSIDVVDVSCFAGDWGAARELAAEVHVQMLRLIGASTSAGVVDDVAVLANPGPVPYGNRTLHRHVGTYEVHARPI